MYKNTKIGFHRFSALILTFLMLVFLAMGCSSSPKESPSDTKNPSQSGLNGDEKNVDDPGEDDSDSKNRQNASNSSNSSTSAASDDPFYDLAHEDLVAVIITADRKMVLNAVTNGEILSMEPVVEEVNRYSNEHALKSNGYLADSLFFNEAVLSTDKNMIAVGVSGSSSPDISSYTILYSNSDVELSTLAWPARPIAFSPSGRRLVARLYTMGCEFDNVIYDIATGRKVAVLDDSDCEKPKNVLGWLSEDELKYEVLEKRYGVRSLWKYDVRTSGSVELEK